VWSFSADGGDPLDSSGNTAEIHDYQGSLSLNLLGRLRNAPPTPNDMQSFDLAVSNVRHNIIIIIQENVIMNYMCLVYYNIIAVPCKQKYTSLRRAYIIVMLLCYRCMQ
jgi:hypothetical protein